MANSKKRGSSGVLDIEDVSLSVPVWRGEIKGHVQRHVDLQLKRPEAEALKRLYLALDEKGGRLTNGRRIVSGSDVVRYLLQIVASNENATA